MTDNDTDQTEHSEMQTDIVYAKQMFHDDVPHHIIIAL